MVIDLVGGEFIFFYLVYVFMEIMIVVVDVIGLKIRVWIGVKMLFVV